MSLVPGHPWVCSSPARNFQVRACNSLLPLGRKRSNENLTPVFILCTVKILAPPSCFMRRCLIGKSEGIKMKEAQTPVAGLGRAAGVPGCAGLVGGVRWGVCGCQVCPRQRWSSEGLSCTTPQRVHQS